MDCHKSVAFRVDAFPAADTGGSSIEVTVAMKPPMIGDSASDLERLCRALHETHGVELVGADMGLLRTLSCILRESAWKVTCSLVRNSEAEATKSNSYVLIAVEPAGAATEAANAD
jgi:hypothetical protein